MGVFRPGGRARSVGAARRVGVRHALAKCETPLERVWIASTDADTIAPEDRHVTQLGLATQGLSSWLEQGGELIAVLFTGERDHPMRGVRR